MACARKDADLSGYGCAAWAAALEDGWLHLDRTIPELLGPGKLLALPIWRVAVRRIDGQVIFNSRSGRFFADDGIVFRYRWRVDSG